MLFEVLDPGSYTFSLFAVPTLVTALAILLLGHLVLIRERLSRVSASLFLLTLCVGFWLLTFSAMYSAVDEGAAFFWARMAYLGVPFIAPASYLFTVVVLRVYARFKLAVWATWIVSGFFAFLLTGTDVALTGLYRYPWGYYTRYEWPGFLFVGFFVVVLLASMGHYWFEYRGAAPGNHKLRIRALMIAFAVGYVGVVDFIPAAGVPLYPFGYLAILGFIMLSARAVWVYRLFDITPAFAARQIIDTMTDALLVLDPRGTVRLVNPAAAEMLARPQEALTGRPLAEVIGDPDLRRRLIELAQGGTLRNYELAYLRHDAEERVLSLSATVMRDTRGHPAAVVCIADDITERKRAAEAIWREGQRTAVLARMAARLNAQLDLDAVVRAVCEEAAQALAVPVATVSLYDPALDALCVAGGFGLPDAVRAELRPVPRATYEEFVDRLGHVMVVPDVRALEDVPNAGIYSELDLRTTVSVSMMREGRLVGRLNIATTGAPRHFREDELSLLQGIADQVAQAITNARLYRAAQQEIEERKRIEAALRTSEQRYSTIVNAAHEGIWLLDADVRTVFVNRRMAEMLGYTTQEMLDRPLSDFLGDDSRAALTWRWKRQRAGLKEQYDLRFLCKDGGDLWAIVSTSPMFGDDEQFLGVLNMITDITERKRTQERISSQLQRVAALREIDLAINSSLDLRLTLNVILDQVLAQLGVSAADVLLLNPHTMMLEFAAGRGFRFDGIARTQLRMDEGYAGRAALSRRTFSVPDLRQRADFLRYPLLQEEDFVSYYVAPLVAKGQVLGALEIFHRLPLDPEPEWLDFMEALAAQAALAVDNATLFDNLQRSNVELGLAYDTTLEGWSRALDLRDKETEGHTRRVTDMAVRLARTMGLPDQEVVHLRRGALLHDIGKMGIPDAILLKPGPLTGEEWAIMRRHPDYARDLLSPIPFLRPALDIPYCHHEKWDGSGYPRGLKGEEIPLAARIFAVVDVWDALRSDRPYRASWPPERVREHIKSLAGSHFDQRVVDAFLNMDIWSTTALAPARELVLS